MPLLTAAKETAIAAELAEIFASADAVVFTRPRQIISKQHFIANTTKTILGVTEVRYLEIYLEGIEVLPDDEQQLDSDCVAVNLQYRGQFGFQYMEQRSDASYSFDDAKEYMIFLHNAAIDNGTLIVNSVDHELSRLTQVAPLRIEDHPITEFPTHLWDFTFNVEVRA